jgi:hypothetical protein
MKIVDRIIGLGALVAFGAFLSVIVFKVVGRPSTVRPNAGTPRVNAPWPAWEQIIAPLRPFFIVFNDYMLLILIGVVLLMAAIDFFLSMRGQEK